MQVSAARLKGKPWDVPPCDHVLAAQSTTRRRRVTTLPISAQVFYLIAVAQTATHLSLWVRLVRFQWPARAAMAAGCCRHLVWRAGDSHSPSFVRLHTGGGFDVDHQRVHGFDHNTRPARCFFDYPPSPVRCPCCHFHCRRHTSIH